MIPLRAAALLFGALLVSGCSAAPSSTLPSDVQVTVDMKEYAVTLTPASIKAGTIKFGIRNSGTLVHEFDLIKTDLAADKLPLDAATAKAREDGLVKQLKNIGAGAAASVSADLQPGRYLIVCNVPGHYQLGMRAAFTVQ